MMKAVLIEGYQVASGMTENSPFEKGTIELQKPFFKQLGLDLERFFMGTLNLDIAPYTFEMKNPCHTFENIQWTRNFPSETFSFSTCTIIFNGETYDGYIYYPHPETKIGHFQKKTVMEVIMPKIDEIFYGDAVEIILNFNEIEINK